MADLFKESPAGKKIEKKEQLLVSSIRLEFFRHSKKGPQTEGMQEYQCRLTEEGRLIATASGKDRQPNPETALIYGSSRDRAQETAYRQLLSNQEEVTATSSLEDIEALIKGKLPLGSKKIIDERLNFNWNGSTEFNEALMDHFMKVKDALRFLVEESDGLALKSKDKTSTSYTRSAANTAEIIQKYLKILPNWEKITSADSDRPVEEKKNYAKNNNEMQRFLGSHGATVENFLLKLIDKIEGREATLEFIKSLPEQNSFQFNDGYSVRIYSESNQPKIEIKYHDRTWKIGPEMLDEFIKERDELNKKVEEK